MNHLFRYCHVTREVWRSLSFQCILRNHCEDFVQWITWAIEQLNLDQSRVFCCALSAIWGDRNKRIHEGKIRKGTEVANLIISYIKEIDSLEKRDLNRALEKKRWSPPQESFMKINFDGAYDKGKNQSGVGIVARDSNGTILFSYSEIHFGIPSAFAAEAIACRKGVQMGIRRGWRHLILEGDSLTIVKKCKSKSQDRSMVGVYIFDIQQEIYGLENIRFQYIPRSANGLAHIIATESLRRGEEFYLDRGVPDYAMDQARLDGRSEEEVSREEK
ncbi:uncharacterized protein LOC128043148 [Gossypium raimondii]|uniref:uncharacterized protein LOC128043148 n=1 Tax=Gossypium raimondii TaxID=29730 RepID=UPI00227C67AC|nr:uncharacterized protein LOC128043148 [Gossypium raimondii]